MALSHELISQFAKIVKGDKKQSTESTVYGTIVTDGNGNKYVKLDGSDQLTPLSDDERPSADSTTTSANEGERVSVLIKIILLPLPETYHLRRLELEISMT